MAGDDGRILSVGLNAVDQLLSRGIFEVELLVDGDRLLAIDLNPRAFGFIMRSLRLLPHRGGLLGPFVADAWRSRRGGGQP